MEDLLGWADPSYYLLKPTLFLYVEQVGLDPQNCLLELSEKLLPAEQRLGLLGFLQYCLTKLGDWTDGLAF